MAGLRATPGAEHPTADAHDEAPSRVTGFAEWAVRRWADAGASPGALAPPSGREPAAPLDITATHPVASRQLRSRYWAITLGVEAGPGPSLWFVEIGVLDTDAGLVAAGLPAVVPSPVRAEAALLPAGRTLKVPAADDPIAVTTQAFLDALLAGRGDVSRYLAPGAHMEPVTPTFDSVRVLRTAEVTATAGRNVVRLEAAAVAPGVELRLGYELTLEQRAGRWEVRRLSGAPTLRPGPTGAAHAPSTTSPPATSTSTAVAPATPGA